MTNLIAVVFFYYGYHPEDGRVTDSNMLKTLQQKYIIQLKCICWLLIYFIHLINAWKINISNVYNPIVRCLQGSLIILLHSETTNVCEDQE